MEDQLPKGTKLTQRKYGQYIMATESAFAKWGGDNVEVFVHDQGEIDIANPIGDMLIVGWKQSLWQQELERYPIKTPLDWFEHFKDRWYPRWAKKLWPVKWDSYDQALYCVYPFKRLAFPKESHYFVYQREASDGRIND
jgi:hypothetical protein